MKIVFLPGLDGSGMLTQADELAGVTGLAVELVKYPLDLTRYSDILDWLKPQLPAEEYVLVAESFSGPIAACIGAAGSPFLKGIVFIATFARRPRRVPVRVAKILRVFPVRSAFAVWLGQPFLAGRWSSEDFVRHLKGALGEVPKSTLSARLGEVLSVDATEELTQIAVPMLYIRAREDRLIPRRSSDDFTEAGAELAEVEGPHFLAQTRPEIVAKEIARFLISLDA